MDRSTSDIAPGFNATLAMVDDTVKFWNDDEGWGVLTSPEVPGEVWAIFSRIEVEGYASLDDGEHVQFDWEPFPAGQDGYFCRATRIVRLSQ